MVLAACSSGAGGAGGDRAPESGDDPLAPVPTTQPAAVADSGYGRPAVLGNLADVDITESSGLAASRRNPGLYWTHNDSDDGPLLYCLEPTGAACGVWQVTGASARDWEDIAAGPGPEAGTNYLYAGDIGDNLVDQDRVTVYRVPDPAVSPANRTSTRATPVATEAAEAIRLRYPDGPHNAEALMVHPVTGDLYVVTKEAPVTVYVARAPLRAGSTVTMETVATLPLGDSRSQVTGGAISPDGTRVAVATYLDGLEWRLPAGAASFDAVWQQPPRRLTLGRRFQGESIAYRLDGNALLTTTEGARSPIHQIERV